MRPFSDFEERDAIDAATGSDYRTERDAVRKLRERLGIPRREDLTKERLLRGQLSNRRR